MAAVPAPPPHHHHVDFHTFDARVERLLGADLRLIYGMTVPILVIVGLVIVLALHPQSWIVAAIVVIEVAALGLVLTGIFGMLEDEDPGKDAG